jgi:membrane protein YdbS with pleckstrin-like domain
MRDKTLFMMLFISTPVMLLIGIGIMYLFIGDHAWFPYMVAGYTLLLATLYTLKIAMFRYLSGKKMSRPDKQSPGSIS